MKLLLLLFVVIFSANALRCHVGTNMDTIQDDGFDYCVSKMKNSTSDIVHEGRVGDFSALMRGPEDTTAYDCWHTYGTETIGQVDCFCFGDDCNQPVANHQFKRMVSSTKPVFDFD